MKPLHFALLAWNSGILAAFGVISVQSVGLCIATWALFVAGCIALNGGMLLITILFYTFVNPLILCLMEFK